MRENERAGKGDLRMARLPERRNTWASMASSVVEQKAARPSTSEHPSISAPQPLETQSQPLVTGVQVGVSQEIGRKSRLPSEDGND